MVDMVEMYRINGEKETVPEIDAKQACRNHPNEWSRTPWTLEMKKRVEAKQTAEQRAKLEDDKAKADASDALKAAKKAAQEAHAKAEAAKVKLVKSKAEDDKEALKKAVDEAEEAADAADEEVRKLTS
jgi:hypothetical protein